MTASDFSKLAIWQRGMNLAEKIYFTKKFPREEMYGLSSQMRRAAVSVPSNIAEGSQRHSRKEFANFLSIAKGSLGELKTQLIPAERMKYLDSTESESLHKEIDAISRMLHSFHSQLIPHTS